MEKITRNSGSIKEIILLVFPMVLSFACDTIMIFTDRMFLSKLGPLRMNAAMGGGMLSFVAMAFFLGMTGYSTALVAQYLGAGQKKQCAIVTTQSFFISAIAYPLILMSKPIMVTVIQRSGIQSEQAGYQITYFNVILFSTIFSLIRSSLSGFFCGTGKTKIVMQAAIVSMVANIVLNYILIFGKFGFPALGIKGAAIGTILGGVLGVIILLSKYFGRKCVKEYETIKGFVFDRIVMLKLLRFGYPAGIELFLNFGAFTGMTFLFHSEGVVAATATTIMLNWDMVSFVPLLGVEFGVTSLVGRYMGAQRADIAHKSTMSGLKLSYIYSGFIFVIFVFFTKELVGIFKPEVVSDVYLAAVPIAVLMIRLATLYVFVEAVIVTFVGALRGAGDTFYSMCLTVGLHVFIVVVSFICLKIFNMPVEKAWIAVVTAFICGAFLIYLRYRSGKWKSIKVVTPVGDISMLDGFHEV